MNTRQIEVDGTPVEVVFKDIKNVHLSVHPPTGRVRIAAPNRMRLETIRVYAIAKLNWIKQRQTKFREQQRETAREYIDRESHYVWGQRYLLSVVESESPAHIELKARCLVLRVPPSFSRDKRHAFMEAWYREQVKQVLPKLIAKWEPIMGVQVNQAFVQRMKTKWGSCNPAARTIRLNTELAKKPRECLEYVVVHEMAHLLEPTHNARFIELMNHFLPSWPHHRALLNQLPISHEEWAY